MTASSLLKVQLWSNDPPMGLLVIEISSPLTFGLATLIIENNVPPLELVPS